MQESRKSRGIKEFNLVNNHNVTKLYFTANISTLYTSYSDNVYELLRSVAYAEKFHGWVLVQGHMVVFVFGVRCL